MSADLAGSPPPQGTPTGGGRPTIKALARDPLTVIWSFCGSLERNDLCLTCRAFRHAQQVAAVTLRQPFPEDPAQMDIEALRERWERVSRLVVPTAAPPSPSLPPIAWDELFRRLRAVLPRLEHLTFAKVNEGVPSDLDRALAGAAVAAEGGGGWPSLLQLTVAGLAVDDERLTALLAHCPRLQQLRASFCHQLRAFAHPLPCLTHLDLTRTKGLTDEVLVAVATGSPRLEYLSVAGCPETVTKAGIEAVLQRCPLKYLNISGVKLPPHPVLDFGAAPRPAPLQTFYAAWCMDLTDASLAALAERAPHLTALNVSYCTGLSDAAVAQLLRAWPRLTRLNVKGCLFTDVAVVPLVAPGLTELDVSHCQSLTERAAERAADGCPGLTRLDASRTPGLGDATVRYLAERLGRGLRHLVLEGCRAVTDAGLDALALHCPNLRELNLYGCREVTDAGVARLKAGCPRVKEVKQF